MKIFLKHGIPPLLPLFLSLCGGIAAANYGGITTDNYLVIQKFQSNINGGEVANIPIVSNSLLLVFLVLILFFIAMILLLFFVSRHTPKALQFQHLTYSSYRLPYLFPYIFVILFFISGYYLFKSSMFPDHPPNHISNFTDKGISQITGTISSVPEEFYNQSEKSKKNNDSEKNDRRIRFNLSVENIMTSTNTVDKKETAVNKKETETAVNKNGDTVKKSINHRVTGIIQMTVYRPLVQYNKGDTIQFKGKIKSIRNFNNPGGFDYVRYMKLKDIWGKVSTNGKNITSYCPTMPEYGSNKSDMEQLNLLFNSFNDLNSSNSLNNLNSSNSLNSLNSLIFFNSLNSLSSAIIAKIDNFRDDFATHIFKHIDNRDSAAILCALSTGNKEFVSKELSRDFSRTGGSHILAISGLHLSIVATLFFYMFNAFLSCFKWVLIRGWSKKGAALLTILPIVAYAVLSGYSDATERAMIMIIIFMIAAVIERESNSFNSLCAAGIVILILNPASLFMVSFQLSFSAVFFILMGLSLSADYKIEIKNSILKKFTSFIFISMCAIAGTQILVMHYFNIFSFSGLIVNIILIPCVGFGALSLGLAALFFYPFSLVISGFLIQCAGLILTPCIAFIKTVASLPWSYIETFKPDILEIACYYLFVSALFVAAKAWKKESGNVFVRGGVTIALLSCLTLLIHEAVWIKKRFFNDDLVVTILDVGQGNSALIEMPQGKSILVDGGGFFYGGNFDTGEHIIAPFLRLKKIMTLDAVVLTHPDSDHMNGLVYIFKHFKINLLIKNCDQQQNDAYKALIAQVEKKGTNVYIVDHRSNSIKIGKGELHFFHPLKVCPDTNLKNINTNSFNDNFVNDNSVNDNSV
ncbi:MAG: ComEC/Rec2 family competence protein, partial [Desulfamplus sp.]|nr:ComEC/Rec2 family competence protein [Desulfamplus sp.]